MSVFALVPVRPGEVTVPLHSNVLHAECGNKLYKVDQSEQWTCVRCLRTGYLLRAPDQTAKMLSDPDDYEEDEDGNIIYD